MASNIHPVVAIAGASLPLVRTIIDPAQGDVALDYRDGEQSMADALKTAGIVPSYALDAISEHGTSLLAARLLGSGGRLAHVLPLPDDFPPELGISSTLTMVGDIHGVFRAPPGAGLFGEIWMHAFARGLRKDGWLSGHPWEVVDGGLGGLQAGLVRLKEGQVRGKKLVFKLT